MKKYLVIFLLIAICVLLSSCYSHRYIVTSQRYPIIEKSDFPKFPKITLEEIGDDPVKKKLFQAFQKLKKHAKQLEAGIDEYNRYGRAKNQENGYIDIKITP